MPVFLMLLHPLTNFDIQKYYKNKPKFNGAYLRNNLPKIKDGVYIINLDDYKLIWTHCIAFYVNGDNVTYSNSFGVEHFPSPKNTKLIETKISQQVFIEYKQMIQ